MSETALAKLERALRGLPTPLTDATAMAVAFSGGLDSMVLLAALARLDVGRSLRALHIDHGLAPQSAEWARFCESAARALNVDFETRRIELAHRQQGSLEAAAREARYGTLAALLEPGEWLLTAHHADDQLETLLHRLARGAGVGGMRGIRDFADCGRGYLVRPLLDFTRTELEQLAKAWALDWIDDPSNEDLSFDRNYLRSVVVPALVRRFPAAGRAAVRQARAMADAQALLTALALADAAQIDDPGCIPLARLRALDAARQRNLLRFLIRSLGLPLPDARQLETLLDGLSVTRPDAATLVSWPGAEARIWRDRMYLQRPLSAAPALPATPVTSATTWSGPDGRFRFVEATGGGLPDEWLRQGLVVGFRRGGERFRPHPGRPSRRLKQWLQDQAIVPWMRDRIPLFFRDDEIVAIGDLWAREQASSDAAGRVWRLDWADRPRLR
jgi:tRNA(Ile)-lysidine synthase